MAEDDDRRCLNELRRLRLRVDFRYHVGKYEFLERLYRLIENWTGQLPNLRHIFQESEIDQILLWDYEDNEYFRRSTTFVQFAVRTGYRDVPRLDINDAPILNRCTALHRLAVHTDYCSSSALFAIYDRYDANYRDRSGFTHFHAACKLGFRGVVREFLEVGRVDPDLVVYATGDRPLHLAIQHERSLVFEELLLAGADPNLPDGRGETPLHLACRKRDEGAWARLVLSVADREGRRALNVNAPDNEGRIALHAAVANLLPDVILAMLDRGLNMCRPFPRWRSFEERLAASEDRFAARLAAGALGVVEIFEAHGFTRIPAMHIMRAFSNRGLLRRSALAVTTWHAGDEEFAEAASEIRIDSSLSLYDLLRLSPSEAARAPVTWTDYFEFACSSGLWTLPERHWLPCSLYLCEIMMRRLCRRVALFRLCRMMLYALPIDVCEAILDSMSALDLYSFCVVSVWPIVRAWARESNRH
ncbi:unnamed protein product [Trichogramma brassicae]|uniref:Uncharacterized protein n=1 Tax=Trichogramma brassicae TaxID=86971 RepID=A0A6H5J0B9_9HYME|nr:unnamed protein product [Trichogramma brassicae]